MNIAQIIQNGRDCMARDASKRRRNKQLGVIRGPLPGFARKSKLSGMARKIGYSYAAR